MSAREELFRRVAGSFVDEDKANKLIDDLLHEEAEKLRLYRDSSYGPGEFKAEKKALNGAINLLDPYAK